MSKEKKEEKVWEATKLPGGVATLLKVWEQLRDRNDDGYVSMCGGILAVFDNRNGLDFPPDCTGTVCSPFVACATGVAFDPKYPRDDLKFEKDAKDKKVFKDAYVPMANKGQEPLPYRDFYNIAKDDSPGAVIKYGLGRKVAQKELRRGDVVGIDWVPPPGQKGGGHAVFVWDVHLDANGDVDAFQYLSSNGHIKVGKGGVGVSIGGCQDDDWFKDSTACAETEKAKKKVKKKDPKTKVEKEEEVEYVRYKTHGSLKKKPNPLFDLSNDDIVKKGTWCCVPDNKPDFSTKKKKEEWLATFKVRPEKVLHSGPWSVAALKCARFWYDDDPPKPNCMKDGAAPPPSKPGHTEAPAVVVKGEDIKKDPQAPKKVPPKPAKQEKDKPVDWQYFAEQALKVLFQKKWITTNPGKSDDIHDSNTQAALKEFQKMFELVVDGILGKETVKALQKHLPAAQEHHESQKKLRDLHTGKKIDKDPRPIDGTNHDKTKDAVKEFQGKHGLKPTGVPDADTKKKIEEVHASHAPTADAPGLDPRVKQLYWVGNGVDPGGTATLRLHSSDLKVCELCDIHLLDDTGKKDVKASVQLSVDDAESKVDVPIPADFPAGSLVNAKVVTQSAGELTTWAPIRVGGMTEAVDWRPYIDQDSVPDDLIEKIKRNRAKWPDKSKSFNLILYQHDKKGNVVLDKKGNPVLKRFGGENHYDYSSTKAHRKWAVDYFQKNLVDPATDRVKKHVAQAWVQMLSNEGLPASFQTYDNQIITWGAGFGGMGDGVYVFDEMNKDPKLKRILDDVGMNYASGRYHVVDVNEKKVISTPKKKRDAHLAPLDSVRKQMDLMSALVGMSEDPATRVPIAEAQFQVYLKNSTQWGGQDKVFGIALYFLITHMHHWLPAIGNGVNVNALWATMNENEPTADTDKKLAQLVGKAFVRTAMTTYKRYYSDVYWRTRWDDDPKHSTLWKQYRSDAKAKDGYDPGVLEYDADFTEPPKPPKW